MTKTLLAALFIGGLLINSYRYASVSASQGFEGTGAPSLWSDTSVSNTVDWDYTASPLVGAQSLFLASPASNYRMATYDFPEDADEIWTAWRMKVTQDAGNQNICFHIYDTGSSIAGGVLTTSGQFWFYVTNYTPSANVIDMAGGTEYRVKVRYVKGTGSNETIEVWAAANGAGSWGTSQILTNGITTTRADSLRFYMGNTTGHNMTIDNVLVKTSDIAISELD